jgi:hypothetical protein
MSTKEIVMAEITASVKVRSRVLSDEKIAGVRAKFHVFYKNRRGVTTVSAAFTETTQEAEQYVRQAQGRNFLSLIGTVKTEGGL